jgi:hypothetical protein
VGGLSGLAFLSTIEVFDGFSTEWGFSYSDMTANIAGTAMVISQQLLWGDQRVKVKFSYHNTKYPPYRKTLLGTNTIEKIFKDYNGQTYWLSANIFSLTGANSSIPKWLNLSLGYGADGMTGARENTPETTDLFDRVRQYYVAPDIDLTRIPTNNKLLKKVFECFGFLKIPGPAIEIRSNGTLKGHWLYF